MSALFSLLAVSVFYFIIAVLIHLLVGDSTRELRFSRFRQGRGCMDQVFAVRQVCEKYLANGKDVFWAFTDFEKAYDTTTSQQLIAG